jgi:hypothetical protein
MKTPDYSRSEQRHKYRQGLWLQNLIHHIGYGSVAPNVIGELQRPTKVRIAVAIRRPW